MVLYVGKRVVHGTAPSNPSSPSEGDIYWNSQEDELRIWTGSNWVICNNELFGSIGNPATDPYGQLRTQPSGNYYIQPSGQSQIKHVYVNNTDNGGGWVLAARVRDNSMNHYNTGQVNLSGSNAPRTNDSNTTKLSDSYINSIHSASSYTGSTAWWLQTDGSWSSDNSHFPNMFVDSNATMNATDHAFNQNARTRVSTTFEGSLSDRSPNNGTRGFGDHHTDPEFFAWVRHPEQGGNNGFRQDSRGQASGFLWVK